MHRPSPFRTDERGLLGPTGPIGPAFSEDLMRSVVAATYHEDPAEPTRNDLAKWGGTLTAMEAFQPRTAIEAMLAAQAIAAHHAIMECYIRAMHADLPEELATRVRANAVGLTRAMDITLRALERLQARPVPPPLPDVPAAVDAVLDLELERARRRARAAAAGDAGATGPGAPAEAEGAEPPAAEAMRPAIVIPRLEPHPPVDKTIMEAKIAALHAEIHARMDRVTGGTPQEWYAREREEVRLRDAAKAAAKAALDAERGDG